MLVGCRLTGGVRHTRATDQGGISM